MMPANLGVIVTLFCLMLIGFLLGWRKVIGQEGTDSLARLISTVAIPAATGYQGLMLDTAGLASETFWGIGTALLAMVITLLVGMGFARVLRIPPPERKGLFAVHFSMANTIFVGLPVVEAFYGPAALPYVIYYFIGNTVMAWSIGSFLIQRDGVRLRGESVRFRLRDLRRIFSPPLLAFLLGLAVNLSGLMLPSFFTETVAYLSRMATPLAMVYTGILIYHGGRESFRPQKGLSAVLAGRFLISPLIMLAIAHLGGLPVLMRNVFVMEAAMPAMAQAVVIAGTYGADKQYAASVLSFTLIVNMVTAPLWVWGLSMI